jgi:hypothetical protein
LNARCGQPQKNLSYSTGLVGYCSRAWLKSPARPNRQTGKAARLKIWCFSVRVRVGLQEVKTMLDEVIKVLLIVFLVFALLILVGVISV